MWEKHSDANNAYLNYRLPLNQLGNLAGNQQSVLNGPNAGANIPVGLGALTSAGLSQLSGHSTPSHQQVMIGAATQFMTVMGDTSIADRGGAMGGAGAFGYAEEELSYTGGRSRSKSEKDAYAAVSTKAVKRDDGSNWSVWGSASPAPRPVMPARGSRATLGKCWPPDDGAADVEAFAAPIWCVGAQTALELFDRMTNMPRVRVQGADRSNRTARTPAQPHQPRPLPCASSADD